MLKRCKVSATGTVVRLIVFLAAVIVSHQEESASSETDAVKIESGIVHELSDQNFTDFLQDKIVLVKFYAPWCGHCKALEGAYKEAAMKVANAKAPIYFAKIDATIHNISAKNCNISGYPTLKLFRNSQHDFVDYNGGRSADDIASWVLRKSGPQTIALKTAEELKDFSEKNPIAVYAYFANGQSDANFKIYDLVAESFEKISFAVLENRELAKEFNSDADSFMVINVNGERLAYTEEWSTKKMKKFVGIFSSPKVVDFNHDTAQVIFGSDIVNHTLLFLSRKNGDYEKINDLTAAIDEYRGKVMFVSIDTDIEDHQRILEFFGVKPEDGATIRIISFAEEEMLKYRLLNEGFSADNLKESLSLFIEGKLQQTLSSESVPEDWDKAPVKILVGNNFDEVLNKIRKPSEEGLKYLLVEFYAPWCAHCKRLEPIYEQLAVSDVFKDSSKYWIAKMDSTKNEVTQAKIYTFPTIRLYWRKENGDLEQVEYSGERNLESMKKFVLSGGQSADPNEQVSDDVEDETLPPKDEL